MAWLLPLCILVGLRWFAAVHLPTYVWTRDSGSYVAPALSWLGGNSWVTSARRGPLYSLFIAAVFKGGGTLATVALWQALLGGATALVAVSFVPGIRNRVNFWPIWACAIFYVLYGLPIELERLIRNETLLTLLCTLAFGTWFVALRSGRVLYFTAAGFFAGLVQLLKGIFPVLPVIVVVTTLWNWRRTPRRAAVLAACYSILFLVPLISSKLYSRLSGTMRPPEPEDGQMFYGRTAQWTYLDGGMAPEIKAQIRAQVEAYADRYRATGKLDNNEIVKRTVIPSLKTILVEERGGTLVDVNRFCWKLGLEAVAHHPTAYLRQLCHDFYYLNFISAQRFVVFQPKQLQAALGDAERYVEAHPVANTALVDHVFALESARVAVQQANRRHSAISRFSDFLLWIGRARLLSPVFLSSLCIPLLVYRRRGRERLYWVGVATLWFYYLLLLSTVGRPLDRYLMPVVPLMLWAITAVCCDGWRLLLAKDFQVRDPATKPSAEANQFPSSLPS